MIYCHHCGDRQVVKVGARWVKCPECTRIDPDMQRSRSHVALRECSARYKRGETGPANFAMAVRQALISNHGDVLTTARIADVKPDVIRKIAAGQDAWF